MADGNGRVVVAGHGAAKPFRHRHDGWTAVRQARFLERLAETGCVSEACRLVGLSTTSAYRAYARMPGFAAQWDGALAARRPMLEDAAFERAVRGITVPLIRLGQVVGERRQYSDAILRFLLERQDRRDRESAEARRVRDAAAAMVEQQGEDAMDVLMRQIEAVTRMSRAEERRKAIAWAERMEAEGKAP